MYLCACAFVCKCVGVQGLLEKYAGSSVFTNASSALRSICWALGDELDLCEHFFIITYVLKIQFFRACLGCAVYFCIYSDGKLNTPQRYLKQKQRDVSRSSCRPLRPLCLRSCLLNMNLDVATSVMCVKCHMMNYAVTEPDTGQ